MKHSYRVPGIATVIATLLISLISGWGQALAKDGLKYSTTENEVITVPAPGVLRNELTLALSNPKAVRLRDGMPVKTYGRTSIVNTLTDGFAYDPLNPIAALPALNYSAKNSFVTNESAGATIVITYDIPETILTVGSVIVFDLYGRSDYAAGFNRDDDFDIEFLSGGVVVGKTVSGVIIQAVQYPPSPEHVRVSTLDAGVAVGATIDQIRIIARDSNGLRAPNYFTLQEVRAAHLKPVAPAVISHDSTSANGAVVVVKSPYHCPGFLCDWRNSAPGEWYCYDQHHRQWRARLLSYSNSENNVLNVAAPGEAYKTSTYKLSACQGSLQWNASLWISCRFGKYADWQSVPRKKRDYFDPT